MKKKSTPGGRVDFELSSTTIPRRAAYVACAGMPLGRALPISRCKARRREGALQYFLDVILVIQADLNAIPFQR